ncbi:phosphoribosylformylglycinamidine cyclo-ligase [Gemmatimonadota bacterium]
MSEADKYKEAGVDLDAAERAKSRMAAAVSSTHTSLTVGGFGAFGGMVRIPEGVDQPALVMSTDGVGTKVLVAIAVGRHDTVGEDLVNHSVNDILVHGAQPLAFLDYIAGSNLETETIAALVEGVARACRNHEMSLAGGETAQMPDLYHPGHYDLAGTIVGVVSESSALHGEDVQPGNALIGYASNGLHTNGYTLARHVFLEELGLKVDSMTPELEGTVGDVLLAVHTSYRAAVAPVLDRVVGLAHITGGGIPGNLPRSLPDGCGARIDKSSWSIPPLFRLLQDAGNVDEGEMFRVFNMGVGMIAAAPNDQVGPVCEAAAAAGIDAWVVGEVVAGEGVEIA